MFVQEQSCFLFPVRNQIGTIMYIVETRMVGGWENCWTIDEEPMTFPTRGEAQAEILEAIEDSNELDEPFTIDDFRISPIGGNHE